MSNQVLEKVLLVMKSSPHSAASLTLYALASTLEFEQAGYLFKLDKLRDLDDAGRQLAYQLMELMVEGGNGGAEWERAKRQMDELVRNG